MVSHRRHRPRGVRGRRALVLAALIAASQVACLGRIENTGSVLTLPFHASADALRDFPAAPIDAPAPVTVAADVAFAPFVGYYPSPIGFFIKDAAYNEADAWAPISLRPSPEDALTQWFARAVTPTPGGAPRRVHAVVTDFEWYMVGVGANAGRVATSLVVTDASGEVVYGGQHVTEARVPFADALLRAHVREWLTDAAFVAALGGKEAL